MGYTPIRGCFGFRKRRIILDKSGLDIGLKVLTLKGFERPKYNNIGVYEL